ncbi:uncharacterized protein [Solanum lycopersicum]|uniref:uncharacterized protein isoform X1 n=1 Tax=Solanum lycopersicum TaxID=4081 RepID=UPI0037494BE3
MVKIMVARTKQEGAGCQANDERQTLGHCGSCWSCCGAAESLSDCFCIHFGWVNSFLHAKTCKFILVMVANDSILCVRQNISVAANDIVGNTLLVLLRKYVFSIYCSKPQGFSKLPSD